MLVPEASMHEYRFPSWPKNDVGAPRKLLGVQSEAIAQLMQCGANDQLGLSVLALNARHDAGARGFRDNVHVGANGASRQLVPINPTAVACWPIVAGRPSRPVGSKRR